MSERASAWVAFFGYFVSGEIMLTLLTISLPWQIWALLQPVLFVICMFIIGLTRSASRMDDD